MTTSEHTTAATVSGHPRLRIGGFIALALALLGLLGYLLWLTGGDREAPSYEGGEYTLTLRFVIDGKTRSTPTGFDRPLGVALGPDGTVFVSDTGNNRVCAFDRTGKFVRQWGGFGIAKPLPGFAATWRPGLLNFPAGIDVGDDGLVYVADFRNDQICVFSQEGDFVRAFPDPKAVVGRGASGQDGTGIAVTDVTTRDGLVYATDAYQVMIFHSDGELVEQFGRPGSNGQDLDHPNGVAVASDGSVLVADSNHTRLASFSTGGELRWSLATWPAKSVGGNNEAFGLPRGMAIRRDGIIVVADAVRHELVLVNESGHVVTALGRRGVADGEFNFPVDVAVSGDTVAVADKENNRVQVFSLARTRQPASTSQNGIPKVEMGAKRR